MPGNGYFTPELFRFLKGLKNHNDREWFERNKERYEKYVRDPFTHLIAELAPRLKEINPHMVADPRPVGGSMMRIYRDIRFAKDKSPYKTAVAAHFWHAKGKDGANPAYYLHLEPGKSSIGGGIWRPESAALRKIRDAIIKNSERWRQITTGKDFRSSCGMVGESLKRPPAGYDPSHPFIEDIKRKDFIISTALDDRDVCRKDFTEVVLNYCRTAAPFMRFLSSAVGLP